MLTKWLPTSPQRVAKHSRSRVMSLNQMMSNICSLIARHLWPRRYFGEQRWLASTTLHRSRLSQRMVSISISTSMCWEFSS